ncbi:MAG: hypothetical protein C5B59_16610 [Bacteroidetes bacterium]|nr:MAG: hypothetical protein C5B59_16610 [Bacteroidota bacterium]
MKKNYVLVLIILSPVFAHAQFRFGLEGGINLSSVLPLSSKINTTIGDPGDYIYGDQNLQYEKDKGMTRFYVGALFKYKLTKVLKLNIGLGYSQKGWTKYSYNNNAMEANIYSNQYKINFLELSVSPEYGTPVGPGRAFISLGPFLAYGLNGTQNSTYAWLPGSTNYDHFPSHDTTFFSPFFKSGSKRFEFGLDMALGYEFSMGVFVKVAYDLTLKGVLYEEPIQRFSVFQFGAGYLFTFVRNKKK